MSSSTLDDDLSDNLDTIVTAVTASADLSITKSDSPDPVLAGDELTYTLTVTNGGPSTAEDVSITDELPDDVTFVEGVDGNGATVCALLQPGEVVCELGDLGPGESVTVYITVLVDASVPDGTVLVNTATVTSSTPDPNPANNTDTESTNVDTAADIWLDKTATSRSGNPAPVVVYDLFVHNDTGCESDAQSTPTPNCGTGGPSDATNIVVTDVLPLTNKKLIVQFVSPQCTYTKATHTVSCTATNLPAGATVRFVIEAQVQGSVGTILNQASVTSTTPDPDLTNNANAASIVVKGGTGKASPDILAGLGPLRRPRPVPTSALASDDPPTVTGDGILTAGYRCTPDHGLSTWPSWSRSRTNTCSKWAVSGRLRSCPRISSSCAERANTI